MATQTAATVSRSTHFFGMAGCSSGSSIDSNVTPPIVGLAVANMTDNNDKEQTMTCPRCGADCWRDEADVGVGVIYGPWGCPCGWSEDDRYDVTAGPKVEGRYRVDQWGGLTPMAGEEPPW